MSARSALWLLSLTLAAPAAARADDDVEPVRLTLHPAAPRPGLGGRLLPSRRDLVPGNAAALYYRTEAMFFENRGLLMDLGGRHWDEWADLPLKDLPLKDVREKVDTFRNIYKELATAARRRDCDWQLEGRPEGFALLLPELQGYRSLARVLVVKARLEMSDGKFDQALETLQTGYALGYHLAEGPTIIHVLVGAAVVQVMNRRLEELIQQPGAPNLYWPVASLPRRIGDVNKILDEEGRIIEDMAPWLKRMENGPLNQAQLRSAERALEKALTPFSLKRQTYGEALLQGVRMSAAYPEARAFLRERGIGGDEVDALPVFQAVSLFAFRDFREAEAEVRQWAAADGLNHPGFEEARQRWRRATIRLNQLFFRDALDWANNDPSREVLMLKRVEVLLARRFALLRCLEALRLHAASHDGRLPESLDDVKEVPIPPDPVSGRPFRYQRDGDKAVLSAPRLARIFGKFDAQVYEIAMKP